MSAAEPDRILVLGYGNPGRQDDGLGPAIAEEIEALDLPGVTVEVDYQLAIEAAAELSEQERVLFVDAAVDGPEPFQVRKLQPASVISFTSHSVKPESILAICQDTFGYLPEALLIGVRGYRFEPAEALTVEAQANKRLALDFIKTLLGEWKGKIMAGETGKTILIVDDDPDIRAATRIVLESAGFIVGEAASGEEGLKAAQRISPDAILLDLMMETVDAGSKVSTELQQAGVNTPIFLLSSAGDAVRYNLNAAELGLAGIFQKPIDHNVLITTLKSELKIS